VVLVAAGGEAVSHTGDISSWDGGASLIERAQDAFGGLDVLVNNAGILRDRRLVSMSEGDWDAVIAVHLKGTFATSRHAAAYWRQRTEAGLPNDARIINTASPSGLFGSPGQANYGAAKAGIASFTVIAAMELGKYGVTVNAVSPTARTQLTERLMGQPPESGFDRFAPENIAPLVVWLGSPASREVTGRVFGVAGGRISVLEGWVNGPTADRGERWEASELSEVIPELVAAAAPRSDMSGERPESALR
jgi:NAD(P)-dependent dehydrogenase (short-subunit alcohol dehydrogenase family)